MEITQENRVRGMAVMRTAIEPRPHPVGGSPTGTGFVAHRLEARIVHRRRRMRFGLRYIANSRQPGYASIGESNCSVLVPSHHPPVVDEGRGEDGTEPTGQMWLLLAPIHTEP